MFKRLEVEVQRDLAAGKLPPVQPFHAMAYPFGAALALAIRCVQATLLHALDSPPLPGSCPRCSPAMRLSLAIRCDYASFNVQLPLS